jgi:hypothetical protein
MKHYNHELSSTKWNTIKVQSSLWSMLQALNRIKNEDDNFIIHNYSFFGFCMFIWICFTNNIYNDINLSLKNLYMPYDEYK